MVKHCKFCILPDPWPVATLRAMNRDGMFKQIGGEFHE